MQIHLIDGTYELFRAFYAAPPAKSPAGAEVGAARVLLRSLFGWLRGAQVTHAAVAFDTVIESFRNDLFDGYKTGEGIDPALWSQFPLAERVTRALGLVTWSMIEFEADDALATFAARAAADARVERVLLVTPDKDLAQCVRGARVVGFDRHRKLVLDEDGVKAKFGVPPASIPDYLALVGDSADGIPGVPRWGAKSAGAVLSRFGHIEHIPDDPNAWGIKVRGADALAQSLAGHRPEAELYRRLATLRLDVPLAESPDALALAPFDRTRLGELCAELGDDSVLERPGW
ncbi:MAG TPA: 5'-3' exonuclease H3TH domain-containing protein [Polyangiaceae bacterium]|jgi:5'-3' exonuclease|nr:5'-3' exonuclease H3TH domain-containing protein [Polyangiaceae bacterium]